MMQRLLFRREFRAYYGGHGKVWDYYRHALAHPRWEPNIHFTSGSVTTGNPWRDADAPGIVQDWCPDRYDALFLAGLDWHGWPQDRNDMPVVNLIQGVRHAQQGADVNPFLARRAIRLCVSSAVADAILDRGVQGPVLVIDAALDLPDSLATDRTRSGIVIGAGKQPALGIQLAAALRASDLQVRLLDVPMPRHSYLAALAGAEVAVLLPETLEGFYLPALEAMALGCATVVPDCVGNRTYATHEVNALVPDYSLDALVAAVGRLVVDSALRERLRTAGKATALRFSQDRERQAFHAVLDDLPALWAAA